MSECAPLAPTKKLDHPLAPPPSLLAEPPSPKPAASCRSPGESDEATRHSSRVPSVEELLTPRAPDVSDADSPLLLHGIDGYLKAVFTQLFDQLDRAVAALAEPPPAPSPSFASKLVDFLVETLASLAIGRVSASFVGVATATFGDFAAETLKGITMDGAKAVAAGVSALGTGVPRDRSSAPSEEPASMADPTAKTLLEEYRKRQFDRLTLARADANLTLALMARRLPRGSEVELTTLLFKLRDAAKPDGKAISARFTEQLTVGWMNLTAALSLGPTAEPGGPDMLGANTVDGVRNAGAGAVRAWRSPHDGFIEIAVELPEAILGTRGLSLGAVRVPGAPGVARVIRTMNVPLMGLPVFRRVTLVQPGQGPLLQAPAVVITPEGNLEADASNAQLAAIGKGLEVDAIDTWKIIDEAPTARSPSDPTAAATRGMRAVYAIQGASMVASWLGKVPAGVV